MCFDFGRGGELAEAPELQNLVKGEENTEVQVSVLPQTPLLLYRRSLGEVTTRMMPLVCVKLGFDFQNKI